MPSPPPPSGDGDVRRRRSSSSSIERSGGSGSVGGGLGLLLAFGAGLLVYAGVRALFSNESEEEKDTEKKPEEDGDAGYYYCLPPHDNTEESTNAEDADWVGPRCVCCREQPQRFMFVQCRHICLCEACLVHMARDYERTTLHGSFNGPVRLSCPVCRQVGHVVKTYAS